MNTGKRCQVSVLVTSAVLWSVHAHSQDVDPVVIFNTHGSADETEWETVSGTPALEPSSVVLDNGIIRVRYPCHLGQPGEKGYLGTQKAGHVIYLKRGHEYVLAQDKDFGDWTYVGGSMVDDPTGFKILKNTPQECQIELEFDDHVMDEMTDGKMIPNAVRKRVILKRGHYGYTAKITGTTGFKGEREVGFGGTATHALNYSTRFGVLWDPSHPRQDISCNYEWLRAEGQPEGDWWGVGLAFDDSFYRLVSVRPGNRSRIRAAQFKGGLTGNLIHYAYDEAGFQTYEAYVAVVPYDGTQARTIVLEGDAATVIVPEDGKYLLLTRAAASNTVRYQIALRDLALRKGPNRIDVSDLKLRSPIVVPYSNGRTFPEDISRSYREDSEVPQRQVEAMPR